jgi:hypothetical protein
MDDKTILINAYTTTPHTSYEENDNLEAFNDNQQGGVHGITKELMNLTTIVKLIESRNNVGKMWNLNKDRHENAYEPYSHNKNRAEKINYKPCYNYL